MLLKIRPDFYKMGLDEELVTLFKRITTRPWRVVIFQLRVGSGRVVNLKVGLSGTLGSGSKKILRLIGPAKNDKSIAWDVSSSSIEYIL